MRKTHILIFCLLSCLYSFSQTNDSVATDKWVNYKRPRGAGDDDIHRLVNKVCITQQGDTLVRSFSVGGDFQQILKEQSFIHNKQNGLEIAYYPNGNIKEISYYLNGRLWDVISRTDSNGKLENPGNLHNGNGAHFFSDRYGIEHNCYMTYKNGMPEGPFYWQNTLLTYVKGELTYNLSVVQYVPAKKVVYAYANGRQATEVFDTSSYRHIFAGDRDLKIISTSDDSLPEQPRDYRYIDINFDDPAIIPRGTWQVINTKTGKAMTTVVYDSNGNPIKVTQFKENGDLLSENTYPSYNKRKW